MVQKVINSISVVLILGLLLLSAKLWHAPSKVVIVENFPKNAHSLIAKAIKNSDPNTPVGAHFFGNGNEVYFALIYQHNSIRVDKFYRLGADNNFQEITPDYKGQENGIIVDDKFYKRLLSQNI